MKAMVLAFWLALAAAASEPTPRISNLAVAFDEESVLVGFNLRHGLDARILDRIQSGLPTTISYEIQILRDRKSWLGRTLWFDSRNSRDLEVVVKYDAVNEEYLISYRLNGRLVESRVVQDLAEVEPAVTKIGALPVFQVKDDLDRRPFLVRVRADLGSKTLLSLIPTRITTDWTESRRFRPPL